MKKLLSFLGTITIAGSGMAGLVGNAPHSAKNEINSLETNNLENLSRNKRQENGSGWDHIWDAYKNTSVSCPPGQGCDILFKPGTPGAPDYWGTAQNIWNKGIGGWEGFKEKAIKIFDNKHNPYGLS